MILSVKFTGIEAAALPDGLPERILQTFSNTLNGLLDAPFYLEAVDVLDDPFPTEDVAGKVWDITFRPYDECVGCGDRTRDHAVPRGVLCARCSAGTFTG